MEKIRTQHAYEILEELISRQYFINGLVDLVPLVDRMPLTRNKWVTLDPCCWNNWLIATNNKESLTAKESFDCAVKFLKQYAPLLEADTAQKLLSTFTFARWKKILKEYAKVSI
jgi:hypothetical protein